MYKIIEKVKLLFCLLFWWYFHLYFLYKLLFIIFYNLNHCLRLRNLSLMISIAFKFSYLFKFMANRRSSSSLPLIRSPKIPSCYFVKWFSHSPALSNVCKQSQQKWVLHFLHCIWRQPLFFSIPSPHLGLGHFFIPNYSITFSSSLSKLQGIPSCDYLHLKQYHFPHKSHENYPDFFISSRIRICSQSGVKQCV